MEAAMVCFDREFESRELWTRLAEGRNQLMLAPRRIGKTILLNHLQETAEQNGFRALVVDVEGFREERDFFRQCCAAIHEEMGTGARVLTTLVERLSRLMRGRIEGADWRQWLVQTDWQDFADHLLAHLDDHGDEPPWLLLVDELPIFVQALHERGGASSIGGFLYWLRNARQKYRHVRWLYAGSIGLDSIARRHRVEGALNDLEPFSLGPFAPEVASAFLDDLASRRRCTLDADAAASILQRLGWLSPYYLQKIAEDACVHASHGRIDVKCVNGAMERMLGLDKRLYWSTWREHLDRNFAEPERTRLYRILDLVARDPDGVSRAGLLGGINRENEPVAEREVRDLLDTLLADGYLVVGDDGRHRFRMNLLREWWLRYVVL
jgi:hypothetical protein